MTLLMTSLPRSPMGGRTQVQLPLQQRVLWCINETDAQNGHTARKMTGFSCIGINIEQFWNEVPVSGVELSRAIHDFRIVDICFKRMQTA
jgi:hypothetical protein